LPPAIRIRSDECRTALVYVVFDFHRRPLQPRGRSCLLNGEVRAGRADTIHPLESEQIPGRIHHGDCLRRIPPLRAIHRRLQHGLRPR
jgi:hypothetical protein